MIGASSGSCRRTNLRRTIWCRKNFAGPVIEHLGDFFSDKAERLGILFDFFGFDHLLFDLELFGPAFSMLVVAGAFSGRLKIFDDGTSLHLFSGGVGFSRFGLF